MGPVCVWERAGRGALALVLLGCVLAAACTSEPEVRPPTPLDRTTIGTIAGAVRFDGVPPAETQLALGSSAECAGQHAGPVLAGDVRVSDGLVQNAIVYLKEGLGDRVFAISADPVMIDQKACMFVPRITAAQVGQPIKFLNSDALAHNVRGKPEVNRGWNFSLAITGTSRTIKITQAEPVIEIRCDIHPWMQAFLGVFDHPYFAVTGPDGRFRLADVPPGDYVVEAWHERFGTRTATVTLEPKGSQDLTFTFE